MSGRVWTKQQALAIEADNGNILVSAAAGSGKTTVLVERMVRLMTRAENPLPADRFLALTFTRAAADELRARVAARLEKEQEGPGAGPWLKKQKMLLQRAFIGTIDSFCLQLVRENFAILGLPPDIKMGEEGLLYRLAQQAMEDTMERMYESDAFTAFCAMFGRSRSDWQAQEAVRSLYDYTRTLPDPDRRLAGYLAMYQTAAPLVQTGWGKTLLAHARTALDSAALLNREAAALAAGEEALAGYLAALEDDGRAIGAAMQAVEAGDWDGCYAAVQAYAPARLAAARGGDAALREEVKALRGKSKDILQQLAKNCFVCTEEEFGADREQAKPLVEALVQAVRLYGELFGQAKREEKVIDFSDVEHLALQLLRNEEGGKTEQARRISGSYDMVLVDEYQDTNELQNALYQCLAGEDNLFLVGDVKQSIYRFRKANPGIFLETRQSWPEYDGEKGSRVITLGHNFRSGGGVIDGVNTMFSRLMSEQLGDVAYTGREWLIQGGEGGARPGFEVCVVDDPEGFSEACTLARRIQSMVKDGCLVRQEGGERPCHYGDFAILLRTKTRMNEYLAALQALGIPYASDSGDALLQSPEVLALTAVLAAIDNPGDELLLTAAMMGPLYGFSAEDMGRLRTRHSPRGLWSTLLESEEAGIQAFVEEMRYYRGLSMPADRLCEEVLNKSGYWSAVAAMEDGGARRENLLRFVRWAGEVSGAGGGMLHGFLALVRDGHGPEATGFRAVEGHVSVLTIHKSKGLEFPVCFVADTARLFNRSEQRARVLTHTELGVGFYLRSGGILYPTLPLRAIQCRLKDEALSEEMRVLYVALTRAKDRVVAVCSLQKPGDRLAKLAAGLGRARTPYLLAGMGCFADWILSVALDDGGAGPLYEAAGLEWAGREEAVFDAGVEEAVCPKQRAEERYALTARPDEGLVRRLAAGFETPLPRQALAGVPAKVSVSALAKPEGPSLLARPAFMFREGLTAAERGTIQHALLQHADLENLKKDMEAEISRLAGEGLLSEEAAAAVDRKGLGVFLASALARRMLGAGQLLREYDFITSVPAGEVAPGLAGPLAAEPVLVQGIADAVLIEDGQVEIADYKTDRGKTPAELAQAYHKQLLLYKRAVERRLGLPVTRLTLWSFALGQEVVLPIS